MAKLQWIKMQVGMSFNRKITALRNTNKGNEKILFWYYLIDLAGTINDDGLIYISENNPYSYQDFAKTFNISKKIIEEAIIFFQENEMIEVSRNGIIHLNGWSEYQQLERYENQAKNNRERQKRWYQNHKANVNDDLQEPNAPNAVMLTQPNGVEKNRIEENRKEEKRIEENTFTNNSLRNVLSERVNEPNAIASETSQVRNCNKLVDLELIHPTAKMGLEKSIDNLNENQFASLVIKLKQFVDAKGIIKGQYPLMIAINEVLKGE